MDQKAITQAYVYCPPILQRSTDFAKIENPEYFIARNLYKARYGPKRVKQLLVRWLDWHPVYDTWERLANVKEVEIVHDHYEICLGYLEGTPPPNVSVWLEELAAAFECQPRSDWSVCRRFLSERLAYDVATMKESHQRAESRRWNVEMVRTRSRPHEEKLKMTKVKAYNGRREKTLGQLVRFRRDACIVELWTLCLARSWFAIRHGINGDQYLPCTVRRHSCPMLLNALIAEVKGGDCRVRRDQPAELRVPDFPAASDAPGWFNDEEFPVPDFGVDTEHLEVFRRCSRDVGRLSALSSCEKRVPCTFCNRVHIVETTAGPFVRRTIRDEPLFNSDAHEQVKHSRRADCYQALLLYTVHSLSRNAVRLSMLQEALRPKCHNLEDMLSELILDARYDRRRVTWVPRLPQDPRMTNFWFANPSTIPPDVDVPSRVTDVHFPRGGPHLVELEFHRNVYKGQPITGWFPYTYVRQSCPILLLDMLHRMTREQVKQCLPLKANLVVPAFLLPSTNILQWQGCSTLLAKVDTVTRRHSALELAMITGGLRLADQPVCDTVSVRCCSFPTLDYGFLEIHGTYREVQHFLVTFNKAAVERMASIGGSRSIVEMLLIPKEASLVVRYCDLFPRVSAFPQFHPYARPPEGSAHDFYNKEAVDVFVNKEGKVYDLVGSEFPLLLHAEPGLCASLIMAHFSIIYDQITEQLLSSNRTPEVRYLLRLSETIHKITHAVGSQTPVSTVNTVLGHVENLLRRSSLIKESGPSYFEVDHLALSVEALSDSSSLLANVLLDVHGDFVKQSHIIVNRCMMAHCCPDIVEGLVVSVEPKLVYKQIHDKTPEETFLARPNPLHLQAVVGSEPAPKPHPHCVKLVRPAKKPKLSRN